MEKDGARTLVRAFSLLDVIATTAPTPQRLSALALATGLHKATAHRLLVTLRKERFVEFGPQGYSIGPRFWALGAASARRFDLSQVVQPSLARIAREAGDVALFSIRTGVHSECIGRAEGDYPILPTSTKVGTRRPLGCGANALAMLAALSDQDLHYALGATEDERRNRPGFLDNAKLLKRVSEVRKAGYALYYSDYVPGAAGLAVAVCDAWGGVIGAICFTAIEARLRPRRYPQIVEMLNREKRLIEQQIIGGKPQAAPLPRPKRAAVALERASF